MKALNRFIEEVANKQVEDAIVLFEMLQQQIIATSKTAREQSKSFGIPASSNDDMNKKLLESQKIQKQLQTDLKNLEAQYEKLTRKIEDHTVARNRNNQAITNNSINQSILLKNVKEEEILQSNLTTYISKLSVERIRASRVVADYNAQIALGNNLTEEQTAELAQATVQFQKYDKAIKAGKGSIGDAREYVGQYERANRGLSNSINQIARELPSATFGFQTFALGISNNIPIAVDEIKNAIAANKELISQGKPVASIWTQVGSALISFNTAMSVGLLLLALYGKEIANFFKELTKGQSIINPIVESQKLLNEATVEGTKAVKDETVELKSNLAIARDTNLSKKERLIAVEKIIQQFPFYFEGLTKEEILAGKTEEAERKLTDALLARAKSTAAMNKIQQEQSKIIDIEENLYQLKTKLTEAEIRNADAVKNVIKVNRSRGDGEAFQAVQTAGNVEQIKKKIKAQEEEKKTLEEVVNRITGYVIENNKASVGLDYQTDKTDKNTKSIKLNTEAREDYLASEYELAHLRLTNVANANKDIMDDEAIGYEMRLAASEQYYQNLLDLANMEAEEELRVLKFTTEDKIRVAENEYTNKKEQLQKYLQNEQITQSQYNQSLKEAEQQLQYDRTGIITENTTKQNIIYENQAEKLVQAGRKTATELERIWNSINFTKADIEINSSELSGLEELGKMLSGIGDNLSVEQIQRKLKEINKIQTGYNLDIQAKNAQRELDEAEAERKRVEREIERAGRTKGLSDEEIEIAKTNNQALLDLDNKIIEKKGEVQKADNAKTQNAIANAIDEKEELRKVNDAIYEGKLELYDALKGLADQLGQNIIDNYDREIEKSNDYYDALIENAEKGSEQEKALQEQKEAREAALQKRKVEAQRKQAVFNKLLSVADILINLQAEIAKNNAILGTLVANVTVNPLAIASAGIRIGTVLATPLPQYEKGRKGGKEEMALINEKEVEPVESKDGSVRVYSGRNRIVKLLEGDTVHTSMSEFNKNKSAIQRAAIMASFSNQSNQARSFDSLLLREIKDISSNMEKSIEKGFKKAKIVSNNNIHIDMSHELYKRKRLN